MKSAHSLLAGLVGLGLACPVLGFESGDDTEVNTERQAAAYMPVGIQAGSFGIFPKLDVINEYDSNIYRRDRALGETGSYIARFRPGFGVKSNWSRHRLDFKFDSDFALYGTQPSGNDYQDIFTRLDGRLDLLANSFSTLAFSFNRLHENRGSPDQVTGSTPTIYDTKGIEWYYNHKFNRVSFKGGMDAMRYDYQNTPSSTGGLLLMSTRSHWEYMPTVRLGYEIQPEYEAYLKFIYMNDSYDSLVLSNGAGPAFDRNSEGYNALAGMAFDLTGLLTGDVSVGYLHRNYDDPALPSISGMNGFINLKWRPTALTSLTGRFSREIYETTQVGVAGTLGSTVSLGVEHELLRNLILKGGANYTNLDYQGFDPNNVDPTEHQNRNDNLYGATAAVKYLLNRNFSADLTYMFQNRDSNYIFSDYEVHQVMFNVTGQY